MTFGHGASDYLCISIRSVPKTDWPGAYRFRMNTANANTRIFPVLSSSSSAGAQSDQADKIIGYYGMYEWREKARMILFHALDDLNPCILCIFEGTFSLGAPQMIKK